MTTYLHSANRPTANAIADPLAGSINVNVNLIGGRGSNLLGGYYFDQRAVKAEISMAWQALTWGQVTAISAQFCAAPSGGLYLELPDYGNSNTTYHVVPNGRLHWRPLNLISGGFEYDVDCSFGEG